jgi:hypothetical protein
MRPLVCFLIAAVPLLAQKPATHPPAAPAQITLKEVLTWLPADTETVLGANGPFRVLHTDHKFFQLTPDELWLEMRNRPLWLLGHEEAGLGELLKDETVALALEGSRHFRSPKGTGPMLYEGCAIAVFDRDVTSRQADFIKENAPARVEEIERTTVVEIEGGLNSDTWHFLVAFPRPRVVLVATHADYLREVLRRMRGGTGPMALPQSLPEWKYVQTASPLWGMRHFNRPSEGQEDDPSSPFGATGRLPGRFWDDGMSSADDSAIGMAFYFEPFAKKKVSVVYLSKGNAREVMKRLGHLSEVAGAPGWTGPITELAPGVATSSVSVRIPEEAGLLWFFLSGLLGHATYI